MTYFIEVTEYQTYANAEADFHFSYNANSGGGQSFLGGMFSNDKGKLSSPTILDGCIGIFKFVYNIFVELFRVKMENILLHKQLENLTKTNTNSVIYTKDNVNQ